MQPSEETLAEFMCLYAHLFHESLTVDAAREMWTRVMDLYLLLYRAEGDGEENSRVSAGKDHAPTVE